jgi:23S rRNA (cytidine1920-2'-O)/16S rRNA (cytidine1409-2'-O)-methyltransferase
MSPTLAGDPRVLQRDGVNARDLRPSDFTHLFDMVVVDVSFISLTLVLPALATLAQPDGDVVVLVKPQFEVGQVGLGKGGIVRDPALRNASVGRVIDAALSASRMQFRGRMASPIEGGDGNVEFLVWFHAFRE